MITVKIFRNKNGKPFGLEAENHSTGIVCAAVSILLLNAANSLERFTDEAFSCDSGDGGYLKLILPRIKNGGQNHDAELLLSSALLGLQGIAEEYPGEIKILD